MREPLILLEIVEPMTGAKEESIPIPLSVNSVFSKYSITPARGINFGSIEYNTCSEPATIQISNLGHFPIDYAVFNITNDKIAGTEQDQNDKKGQ